MIWYRIDNRLIHGQIIEAWLPYTRAAALVVANDDLAADPLRQQIVMLALPSRVHSEFVTVAALPEVLAGIQQKRQEALTLFDSCRDARRAYDLGVHFDKCNIGNLPYAAGKKRLCQHVAVSIEDENCLRYLEGQGVTLDFRSIPADNPQMEEW